jgi:ABC-type Fe3+ transport system permease subunit
MTEIAPTRARWNHTLRFAVWLGILAWGLVLGFWVFAFLRAGQVTDVTTFVGAVAVIYAAALAISALAYRIADAIIEDHRAARHELTLGHRLVRGPGLRQRRT